MTTFLKTELYRTFITYQVFEPTGYKFSSYRTLTPRFRCLVEIFLLRRGFNVFLVLFRLWRTSLLTSLRSRNASTVRTSKPPCQPRRQPRCRRRRHRRVVVLRPTRRRRRTTPSRRAVTAVAVSRSTGSRRPSRRDLTRASVPAPGSRRRSKCITQRRRRRRPRTSPSKDWAPPDTASRRRVPTSNAVSNLKNLSVAFRRVKKIVHRLDPPSSRCCLQACDSETLWTCLKKKSVLKRNCERWRRGVIVLILKYFFWKLFSQRFGNNADAVAWHYFSERILTFCVSFSFWFVFCFNRAFRSVFLWINFLEDVFKDRKYLVRSLHPD